MPRKSKTVEPTKLIIVPTAREVLETGPPVNETTLQRVYRENRVDQAKLALQPKFEKQFQQLGGMELAIEYLRGSEDPDAIKFLDVWDVVDINDRDFLGFDGFSVSAGVSGKKVFGLIFSEMAATNEKMMGMLTAISMPEVIQATIDAAVMPGGFRDRKLIAQASGWLPNPRLAQTNIQINAGGGPNRPGESVTLPPFDQDIRELSERSQGLNAPKMLEGEV